jgi:hypothetical protein
VETWIFSSVAALLIAGCFGAWHGVQTLKSSSRYRAETRRILRLAAWNLLEPLISTLLTIPVGMWGIAWSFNCGMNGTRGCNQILMGLIFILPFISPLTLLLLPAIVQRPKMLEPWQSVKTKIVSFGVLRFASIVLVSVGTFLAYINYLIALSGFIFLVYSIFQINKLVDSIKVLQENLELPKILEARDRC